MDTVTVQINEHPAVLIDDNIFKIEKPFRINITAWSKNKANRNYAIIGCNYSDDYEECDVCYYTKTDYGKLGALMQKLNKEKGGGYGYIQCMYYDDPLDRIGGAFVEV